jgi:hypothetical protein
MFLWCFIPNQTKELLGSLFHYRFNDRITGVIPLPDTKAA